MSRVDDDRESRWVGVDGGSWGAEETMVVRRFKSICDGQLTVPIRRTPAC
jgi:hypothetical protein